MRPSTYDEVTLRVATPEEIGQRALPQLLWNREDVYQSLFRENELDFLWGDAGLFPPVRPLHLQRIVFVHQQQPLRDFARQRA